MTSATFDRRLVAVGRSLDLCEVERSLLAAIRDIAGTERNLVLLRDVDGAWVSARWDGFELAPGGGDLTPWVGHPAFSVALTATGSILLEPANGAGAGRPRLWRRCGPGSWSRSAAK